MTELETATRARFVLKRQKPPESVPLKIRKDISKAFFGKVKAEFIFLKKNRQYRKIARRAKRAGRNKRHVQLLKHTGFCSLACKMFSDYLKRKGIN